MKITMDMSMGAYKIAKRVYARQISRSDGASEIYQTTGMSVGSAQAFVTIFLAMMDGEVYKRAFNNSTNKFLLESNRKDYGETSFKKALNAAQKHINYYATLGKGKLNGLQKIVDQLNS